jgi:formylglycine-generating enzyme required for sulfatase activity
MEMKLKNYMRYGIVSVLLGLFAVCGCGKDKPTELSKTITGAPMVLIPAGEFQMGTDPAEIPGLVQWLKGLYPDWNVKASAFEDETPRHTVYVDAFYMDIYEVTNAQYRKFVQATGRSEPEGVGLIEGKMVFDFKPWSHKRFNGDNQPVICVSYDDARAYAEWAGKRLPTEAEWEKAVRGGLKGKKYPWGDEFTRDAANYNGTGGKDTWENTSPVGSFSPNSYGLHDMVGNVAEWCSDRYDENYYSSSPKRNPPGPSSGERRVLRCGSWLNSYASYLRCANRDYLNPTTTLLNVGFRCCASLTD